MLTLPTPLVAQPLPGLAVDLLGASTAVPIGISNDRATVYGSAKGDTTSTILYQSVNDGTTWTSVHTFPEGVTGLVETDDGEALAYTMQGGNPQLSFIYKSSGWTASHTAATWTKVLSSVGGSWGGAWSSHYCSFGNDQILAGTSRVGVVSEYGPQTTASGDQTLTARRLWVTQDYGATWTMALDLLARWPGAVQLHMHASAYDPWADRLWATYGDATQDANATQGLLYSDDRGATWTAFPLPTEWVGQDYLQCTSIGVLDTGILLGTDSGNTQMGLWRIARKGYRKFGRAQAVISGEGGIGQGIHRNRNVPGAPIFAGFSSPPSPKATAIHMSYDGLSWSEIWRDQSATPLPGPTMIYGPTVTGKVLVRVATASSYSLMRGEIAQLDSPTLDGYATFTGNGSTTAFTVPHGLGVTPTRFRAWSTNAVGGAFTVTADATNLTVTFTAAPANASTPAISWRAGV